MGFGAQTKVLASAPAASFNNFHSQVHAVLIRY
jgi:hypothetical protein